MVREPELGFRFAAFKFRLTWSCQCVSVACCFVLHAPLISDLQLLAWRSRWWCAMASLPFVCVGPTLVVRGRFVFVSLARSSRRRWCSACSTAYVSLAFSPALVLAVSAYVSLAFSSMGERTTHNATTTSRTRYFGNLCRQA